MVDAPPAATAASWSTRPARRRRHVRLPRSAHEARIDVRYFAAPGYDRVIVVGPRSSAAAARPGAQRPPDVPGALAALRR